MYETYDQWRNLILTAKSVLENRPELLCENDVVRGNFEWDRDKAESNFAIHGVRFQDVLSVFEDPHRLLEDQEVSGEHRTLVIGRRQRRGRNMYTVIFTERGDRKRIISARKSFGSEKETYNRTRYL